MSTRTTSSDKNQTLAGRHTTTCGSTDSRRKGAAAPSATALPYIIWIEFMVEVSIWSEALLKLLDYFAVTSPRLRVTSQSSLLVVAQQLTVVVETAANTSSIRKRETSNVTKQTPIETDHSSLLYSMHLCDVPYTRRKLTIVTKLLYSPRLAKQNKYIRNSRHIEV